VSSVIVVWAHRSKMLIQRKWTGVAGISPSLGEEDISTTQQLNYRPMRPVLTTGAPQRKKIS
jgi:hypothetical protein